MVKGTASGRSGRNRPFASQWAYHFASIAGGIESLVEFCPGFVRSWGGALPCGALQAAEPLGATPPYVMHLPPQCFYRMNPQLMREWADFTTEERGGGH
jgi:hypothetical protein